MPLDYVSYIRSKVGKNKIFLNFVAAILCDEDGKILLQLRGDSQIGELSVALWNWVKVQ